MAGIPPIEPYLLPTAGDLPENVARWAVDPDRAVLLVHDMQRYFLRPFPDTVRGPLVVRNAAQLTEHCRGLGIPVAYTVQPGGMSEQDRGLLKDFWGPGMKVDPADRTVVDELRPAADDWTFTKWRYSAFFRSGLLAELERHGRDQLLVCGVYGHVGVLTTAVEAFSNDIETFLVADAIADFSADHHRMALAYAAQRCAVVTTVKELDA
ncbi:isochorismatase family protein [Streptomyces albus]